MNRKQFILLLMLVIIIGGIAWWHHHQQTTSWSNSAAAGGKLLGNFQVNDVASIRVQQGTNVLTLARGNDVWGVSQRYGYPADFLKISRLLLKLGNLKIIQTEPVAASELPELDLAPPGQETNSATLLEFFNTSGKPLRALWLGADHMHVAGTGTEQQIWPDGRYVLTSSNSTTVAVISDPLNEVDTQPQDWLDKDFFKVQNPESISVDFPEATNSWQLTRTNASGAWKLADVKPGEQLDNSQATETADALAYPNFSDVLNPQDGDWRHSAKVAISTFDGFHYAITIGAKTNTDYYLKVKTVFTAPPQEKPGKKETAAQKAAAAKTYAAKIKKLKEKFASESALANWTYLVPNWTVNRLLKHRSKLLKVKPPPKPHSAATNAPPSKPKP